MARVKGAMMTRKRRNNRKMLSEMAINDPVAFTKLVEIAKNA